MAHLNIEFSQLSLKHHWVRREGHWANICGKREMQAGFPEHRQAKGKPFQQGSRALSEKSPFWTPPIPTFEGKGMLGKQMGQETVAPFWDTQQGANSKSSSKHKASIYTPKGQQGKPGGHMGVEGDVRQGTPPDEAGGTQSHSTASERAHVPQRSRANRLQWAQSSGVHNDHVEVLES